MLRVVTGRFHPGLEAELSRDILRSKASDPLAPLAVIVPSSSLATHVRRVLAASLQSPLVNLHVLTFHQLALRLSEEPRLAGLQPVPDRGIEVLPDFVFEHLTALVGRRQLEEGGGWPAAPVGPGAWAVLWRTLRDLRDAQVDPEVALRGIEEGVFPPEDAEQLRTLFLLQASLDQACRTLNVGLVDDVASAAVAWVPQSPFLNRLARLWYYGFYDLTQVQLTLFEAVTALAPVTLYFSLDDAPGFAFARKFFDRHVRRLLGSDDQVAATARADPGSRAAAGRPQVEVFSTVGPEEELGAAARQILTLVETHGYRFDQIGVVARSLEPYQGSLERIFEAHAIPFTCSGTLPITPEPAVKVLVQLASLLANDFYREPMLDVVTSPFFLHRSPADAGEARPDLWRLAARSLGIIRGEADWRKLTGGDDLEPLAPGDDEDDPESSATSGVPARQLRGLWEAVSSLLRDLRTIPPQGFYDQTTDAFVSVAERHLDIPGLASGWDAEAEADPQRRAVGAAVREALSWLRHLARLEESPSFEEWLATFVRVFEQARMPVVQDDHAGVQVMDAMTARGLSFGALLVLGLNEKTFPRSIQEDPFLHDRHRRVLAETLGYKIDEKLNGYDEEALLLTILTDAAEGRQALFYQRADAEGRALAPSPYLAGVLGAGATEVRIARRLTEREGLALGASIMASPDELAVRAVLAGDDPTPLLAASGREPGLFRHGWTGLQGLEGQALQPGAHDGVTGPVDGHWERLVAKGVSPTSLERYVRCPFQYFSAQVLRLEDLRQDVPEELPAQAWGALIHGVLRACYPSLVERGWPGRELSGAEVQAVIGAAAEGVFAAYERVQGTGYWLLWRMVREGVCDLVAAAIEEDGDELRRSGFEPVAFEADVAGRLGEALGEPYAALPIRGRADRIDRRRDPPALRIVDYKYKQASTITKRDKDLATQAVQGGRLQPPLYALIDSWEGDDRAGPAEAPTPERIDFLYLAPRSEPVVQRAEFPAAAWKTGLGDALRATLHRVLSGIRDGRFFILPDGYCEHCEFTSMCRRSHGPTWQRAHVAAEARALRRMRRQRVSDGRDDGTS